MSSNTNEQQQQLQESFLQQQEKITALKALVRKSGAAHGSSKAAAKEKVKNIAEHLLKLKAESKQNLNANPSSTVTQSSEFVLERQDISTQSPTSSFPSSDNVTHAMPAKTQVSFETKTLPSSIPYSLQSSEKFALMRQQLEQNKLRMAQKASSKQHLEQLVSQLKDKFETSQQCLEDTTELGRSMSDLSNLLHYKPVSRERHKSVTDLTGQNFSLEKERIKFLENRCRLLEKQLEKEKQNNQRNISENVSTTNNEQLEAKISELEILLKENEIAFERREKSLEEELIKMQNIRDVKDYEATEEISKFLKENNELKLELERKSNENLNGQFQQQINCLNLENSQLKQQLELLDKQLGVFTSENDEKSLGHLQIEIDQLKEQIEHLKSNDTAEPLRILNENQQIKKENDILLKRIQELNEINDVLESTKCHLTSKCTDLEEETKQLKADLIDLQNKLSFLEAKSIELENSVTSSTLTSNISHDTDFKVKTEMAKQIQDLMDELAEVKSENSELKATSSEHRKLEVKDSSVAEKIASLEACIEAQRNDLVKSQELLKKYEEELMEKTIELNVQTANFKVLEEKFESSSKTKPLFSSSGGANRDDANPELEMENQQLKHKLDESNKAMIKLKLKCKQMEKQMDNLRKSSDLHEEVVKLSKEKEVLQQKITELEDEKGQWQLTLMETSHSSSKSNELNQDIYKQYEDKIKKLESIVAEKEDELACFKQGEESRVTTELGEIQLEEQVKALTEELTNLRKDIEAKDLKLKESCDALIKINKQKDELDKKLEHYLNENIELLDKVEKLSKSSSSAESIEIVERLTQQEKQELEEFNKRLGDPSEGVSSHKEAVNELTQTEISPEITESLNKLREESSELMNKIELFTTERREVLEKMEHLNAENLELLHQIEQLTQAKNSLEGKLSEQIENYNELEIKFNNVTEEKENLNTQMQEFKNQKAQLSQELTSLQQSSEVVAALDDGETLFEKCEKSLSKLYGELEAYRKANDKKSKFNISKKLAKEAENAHSQLSELLQKVKEASSAVETVTVVETVVAVTAPNGKALAEYEQLTAQNRELKSTIQELRRLLDEARDHQEDPTDNRFSSEERQAIQSEEEVELGRKLQESAQQIIDHETHLRQLQSRVEDLTRELYEERTGCSEKTLQITELSQEIAALKKLSEDFDRVLNDKESSYVKQIEDLTRLRKKLESKCETYEQEMEILQTLADEQKQQLIEAYKEHEHEMNMKLLEVQQCEEKMQELRQEVAQLKQTSSFQGSELIQDLKKECETLKQSLKINKHLVQEQVEELANKQETIDALNQQIMDLYKVMEENANKIIEKEDEISYLQELFDENKHEMSKLEQKNQELIMQHQDLETQYNEQKKILDEHASCQKTIETLGGLNKDQLKKLKMYSVNLKKKTEQCLDYEKKLKLLDIQTETDKRELEVLHNKNVQLQEELQDTHHKYEDKSQELEKVDHLRLSLEQRVQELQQELKKKDLEFETAQRELVLAQKLLVLNIEEVKEDIDNLRNTDIESFNFKQGLQTIKNLLQTYKNELSGEQNINLVTTATNESEHIRQDIKMAQKTLEDLRNNSESEQLRSDLHGVQIVIEKLLKIARQSSPLSSAAHDFNYKDQLREELQCTQENLSLKVKEIEELRQSLMAAQEQLTDWGSESSIKSADYTTLNKVLCEKTAKLENAEAKLEEVDHELLKLREKEYENTQKIQELTRELENIKSNSSQILSNDELENKLKQVSEDLKAKSLKFEKSKVVIKERNAQIQRLQAQLKELQEKLKNTPEEEVIYPTTQQQVAAPVHNPIGMELAALQDAYNKLNEKYNNERANFQETITRLETLHDGIQAKLQEDMSYIETLEQENNTFKEKICRLQECVSTFEERRASVERKVNIMNELMQTKAEEHLKAEDELIYRINMLSDHDEIIGQRLIDAQNEKEAIEENSRKLQTDYDLLQKEYKKLEQEFSDFKIVSRNDYDQDINGIREQMKTIENEMERQKVTYDGKLAAKITELDELECELNEQLNKMNNEKKQLFEKLERKEDDCAAHQNDILQLQENVIALEQAKSDLERESSRLRSQFENLQQDLYELQELRMQSMQDKSEIENLRHQLETVTSSHEVELQALRTQIAELDTLRMQVGQNQTDDQVFIETENKRLTDLLAEKENVIENYQRQNLQLQMAAVAANSNVSHQQDPFALSFGLPTQNHSSNQISSTDNSSIEIDRLTQELQDKNQQIYRLQHDLSNLQGELNIVRDVNQPLERECQQAATNTQTLQSVPSAGTDLQPVDVIPAPPMFFTSDTTGRSPFDELIQHSQPIEDPTEQPPTIEDLQRNVSDLEKHAQDLEHKISVRNQRESDYEDKLRDLETRYQEREEQLQQANGELHKMHTELSNLQLQQQEFLGQLQELQQLRSKVGFLEKLLQDKDEEIKRIKVDEEHLMKTMPSLESQIVPALQDANIQPTLDMFFGNSATAPEFEVFSIPQQSEDPVIEPIIVPKKIYDCYPPEKTVPTAQDSTTIGLDLGEGWGDSWCNSEGTAEAEHFTKLSTSDTSNAPHSLVPRELQLELEMQDLKERLQEQQMLLERSEEQKKELHVKSGKLMKKVKEYKVKIDELQSSAHAQEHSKSNSVEPNCSFDELDAAIQEELKNQIKCLEDRLEDQRKQHESFNLEKDKLLKRIDVLTAGNDRMSEMKERQDMDLQMYQSRIKELQEKLSVLEDWGNEDNTPKSAIEESIPLLPMDLQQTSPQTVVELQKQIFDLTLEIQDLTNDRLELQALLEEEKINANKAEETIAALRLQVHTLEEAKTALEKSTETYHLNNLKLDMQNLKESYNTMLNTKEKLEEELTTLSETLGLSQANEKRLEALVDNLQLEAETLRDTITNTKQNLLDLEAELSLLKEQKEKQISEISCREKNESTDLLKQEIQSLLELNQTSETNIKSLEKQVQTLTEENEYLKVAAADSTTNSNKEELSSLLQEKESEILHLKQRINDLMNEDQTEKLVLEILTKNQEIHLLKMQVKHLEEDNHELENNLSMQITKEMQANKDDVVISKQDEDRIKELENQIRDLLKEKKHMEEELQILNNHVLESLQLEDKLKELTLELDTKNIEITELRRTVDSLKSSVETSKSTDDSVDFVALNNEWQAIVEQRCGEIAKMWKEHVDKKEQDFKATENRLKEEIAALSSKQTAAITIEKASQVLSANTTSSSTPASQSNTTSASASAEASQDGTPLHIRSEDPESIIEKMQAALESQEVEIVTLKEQLAIRSAEYARLAAQYDPFKLHDTSSHSAVTAFSENRRPGSGSVDTAMVSKSELDLAMYMLHQRDMRCEEMTVEIVNLLAERDTLQLKLSNTLRQLEAKNVQTAGLPETVAATGSSLTVPAENSANSVIGSTLGIVIEDDLNKKLSQLQTVSHSKDKVIKEEREQRIRQIEKLQQDVAKMPPAAISELIGSDLSQSNQSPSNVLLNWLWGSKSGNASAT